MANDPEAILPPVGDNHPPAPRSRERLTCEHCECQLTPTGDVLRMSDTARAHLKHTETIERQKTQIADLERELREARAKLAELTTAAKSSAFDLTL